MTESRDPVKLAQDNEAYRMARKLRYTMPQKELDKIAEERGLTRCGKMVIEVELEFLSPSKELCWCNTFQVSISARLGRPSSSKILISRAIVERPLDYDGMDMTYLPEDIFMSHLIRVLQKSSDVEVIDMSKVREEWQDAWNVGFTYYVEFGTSPENNGFGVGVDVSKKKGSIILV